MEVPDNYQMSRPAARRLDYPEHDRGIAPESDGVRDAMDITPLLGGDLVGTDERADLIVENLGGRTGQRRETCIAQFR